VVRVTPAPDLHQTDLHRALVEGSGGDAFVRFELDPGTLERVAVREAVAVAWVGRHRSGVRWATGLAADPLDPAHVGAAVELLVPLAETGSPVVGVTVSRGGRDLLPEHLRAPQAWEWDFWWTGEEPPAGSLDTPYADQAQVCDLDPADERIARLLEVASPSAPIAPGDTRVLRWAGIEDPEGALPDTGGLAALLAMTGTRSGAAHLNDVATHPERRGRALARLLCGQVTTDALRAGAPAVTLGMYADNDAARRVYTALGFTCVRGQTSGRVPEVH
jgi:GNAT superfamily N-acetyltransferase